MNDLNLDCKAIVSPCVKQCKLINGYCQGCHRSLQEISQWSRLSNPTKQAICLDILTRDLALVDPKTIITATHGDV